MAKRATALSMHLKSRHSPKTAKRLAIKKIMLKNKTDKKKSIHKKSQ